MRTLMFAAAAAVCLAAPVDRPAREPLHTIPIEVYRNAIWVQVKVNNSEPLSFILDSAAGRSVVARDTAARIGMHIVELGARENMTPADTAVRMAASPNVEFDVRGARFTTHAAVIGMEVPNAVWGRRFEGVLGAELFAQYVVELDWEARRMLLHDPVSYTYSGAGHRFPIRFAGKLPTIQGRVRLAGQTVETDLLIDSGASSTLALSAPTVEKYGLAGAVEAAGGRLIEGESIGAGGGSPSASTRADWLELGPYRIMAPLTTLSKAKAGSLAKGGFGGYVGCSVLRRFRLILDYGRQTAVFEPNAHLADGDHADASGLRLRARGADLRTYYVHAAVPDSPAAEAEVRDGDVLVSIGGEPAANLTMEQIGRRLRGSGNLALVFDRDGQKRSVRLSMRPLL